jgi:hypothetical protein
VKVGPQSDEARPGKTRLLAIEGNRTCNQRQIGLPSNRPHAACGSEILHVKG